VLKLLAVFLQHTDSKAEQQRLICLPDADAKGDAGAKGRDGSCARRFMSFTTVV